jgi:hypothetical protein
MARHFANWLKAYCGYTAASEAPLDFHFWTGVSTIAACLRRQVWIDQLLFKWTPNFYIIFVGPPGIVTKSTTLNIGFQLLRRVPGIHFGPDSMTWHGLAKKFEAAFEYKTYKNGAGIDVKLPMSPLTCSVSELGTFLRPDDKGLVSFLTDVWDGKERPFDHATKDSGEITIENAWLNVIGATTPMWMQNNFPSSLLAEGIGSRVVFVYGEAKRHLTAYPARATPAKDFHDTEKKLLEDLIEISNLVGEYHLTDDAYRWGEGWYSRPRASGATLASSRYGGYLARKQTHLHKLGMILAAAQRDDLTLTQSDLEEADQILTTTESSMIKVFESVGVVDEAKHLAEVVAFVRAYGFITSKQLYYTNCHSIMHEKDFKDAVRHAIDGGLIEIVKQSGVTGLAPKTRRTH